MLSTSEIEMVSPTTPTVIAILLGNEFCDCAIEFSVAVMQVAKHGCMTRQYLYTKTDCKSTESLFVVS